MKKSSVGLPVHPSSTTKIGHAAGLPEGLDRRELFKFMGASLALAGVTACTRQPTEKIVPYVRQPEEIVPGKPLFFATAMTMGGLATGLLVESQMGRPTKVEGNPLHPASLGATDAFAQASVLSLYDPDRSQTLLDLGEIRPWSAFLGEMRLVLEEERSRRGAGLRILTETVSSPTLARQLTELLAALPEARWHQWEAAAPDNARAGAVLAIGSPVNVIPHVDAADVILSLDADFLTCGPAHVRLARDFAARRHAGSSGAEMNRLYVVESTMTATGAKADHRRPLKASEIEPFARSVAAAVGLGAPSGSAEAGGPFAADRFARAVAADLQRHRGRGLVLAGDHQTPAVHALAHALNGMLGNTGWTVVYTEPIEARPEIELESLRALVADLGAGKVRTLLILGGNPVFNAPADLGFRAALGKVARRVHLSLENDETSEECQWHVPEAHFLEAWSDARAFDGTASIVQPLIAPLYGGKSAHEVLAALSDQPEQSGYELVRATWKTRMAGEFETAWRRALHDGVIPGTALPVRAMATASLPIETRLATVEAPVSKTLSAGRETGAAAVARPAAERVQTGAETLEITFRPDPTIHDGRFANNGWLQELPKPITKVTWDNVAAISPATAQRLGIRNEDVLELSFSGRRVRAPAWVVPGHPDDSVGVTLGYGRTKAGHFGSRAGFDAYSIRPAAALWQGAGVEVRKTGEKYPIAVTQSHHAMEGRNLARTAAVEEIRREPEAIAKMGEEPPPGLSLYPPHPAHGYAWGMAIDLSSCVGCNACVVACTAENNVPIVGKDQVVRGREMQWLRIDHYADGDAANPRHIFQPVACVHCENAPCELVCPTAATVHSAEGLNDMIYNRCVGTRYCSNNCPYKVRRFNFYHYSTQFRAPSMRMLANPDVTVRWRGVMEKCTYCVQRISEGKIRSELENRTVRDGDIVTACQQACPAGAIVFGDIADRESRVSKMRRSNLSYGLLAELGTRPRTEYLAALTNPNPELGEARPA
ncbi:MAG TPA: 4Fe-4S dicluster domain-containing protein [Thermoanaerobaculia bacterium]